MTSRQSSEPNSTQNEWLTKVEKIAEDVCAREGCYLYDLDFIGTGRGRTLRVFIDKDASKRGSDEARSERTVDEADAPELEIQAGEGFTGGVSIDDCSNVSKGLNLILDAEDVVPGDFYNLEVSTPGIDRALRKPWHFEKAVGKRIWVRLNKPLESLGVTEKKWMPVKTIEETLAAADAGGLLFEVAEGPIRVPFDAVEKAKIVFEQQQTKAPHPKKKKK